MMKLIALFFIIANLASLGHCKYVTCDFDSNFCDYTPNEYFLRYTGKSPSQSSGPPYDKTTGQEGYYALCDGRLLKDPAAYCVLDKHVSIASDAQISFWYFMFGTQIGTLEFLVDGQVVWSLTGRQEYKWLEATIPLRAGDYQVF